MGEKSIVFFDGVCGLCNKTVDFLLREDQAGIFLFSPLQGETFRRLAPHYAETVRADSILVLRRGSGDEIMLQRSTAFLFILENLPKYRWLARIGKTCPAQLRDAIYRLVAATRYRIWGKSDACRLPSEEERARFLP
jgi:predicted DCC family thiol-disulfide oxidoreductase YuxK